MRGPLLTVAFCWAVAVSVALAGCQAPRTAGAQAAATATPAPAVAKVVWNGHYEQDIQPIFDQQCVGCHGQGRTENGLDLTSYEGVMKGTQYGPVVKPGLPAFSTLISVVEGKTDLSIRMPLGHRQLGDEELRNLEIWIEAGAPGK